MSCLLSDGVTLYYKRLSYPKGSMQCSVSVEIYCTNNANRSHFSPRSTFCSSYFLFGCLHSFCTLSKRLNYRTLSTAQLHMQCVVSQMCNTDGSSHSHCRNWTKLVLHFENCKPPVELSWVQSGDVKGEPSVLWTKLGRMKIVDDAAISLCQCTAVNMDHCGRRTQQYSSMNQRPLDRLKKCNCYQPRLYLALPIRGNPTGIENKSRYHVVLVAWW